MTAAGVPPQAFEPQAETIHGGRSLDGRVLRAFLGTRLTVCASAGACHAACSKAHAPFRSYPGNVVRYTAV